LNRQNITEGERSPENYKLKLEDKLMIRKMKTLGIFVVILCLLIFGSVTAQETGASELDAPEVCQNGEISGTIVGIDLEEGFAIVTILYTDNDGNHLCTLTIEDVSADHPIVNLLGIYFGINLEELNEAVAISHVCLAEVEGVWYLVDCDEDEFDLEGNVISYQDGTLTVLVNGDLLEFELGENDVDERFLEAIETFTVDWELEDGKVVQATEKIADYHQEGIGFGVLVKLFAMAEANDDLTVEELIEQFMNGTGIGELFKEYGKPSLLGVGHVRQELKVKETNRGFPGMKQGNKFNPGQDQDGVEESKLEQWDNRPVNASDNKPEKSLNKEDNPGLKKSSNENKDKPIHGVCNARASGGSANANGKDINCP
jgi:hypothetical protein